MASFSNTFVVPILLLIFDGVENVDVQILYDIQLMWNGTGTQLFKARDFIFALKHNVNIQVKNSFRLKNVQLRFCPAIWHKLRNIQSCDPSSWLGPLRKIALEMYRQTNVAIARQNEEASEIYLVEQDPKWDTAWLFRRWPSLTLFKKYLATQDSDDICPPYAQEFQTVLLKLSLLQPLSHLLIGHRPLPPQNHHYEIISPQDSIQHGYHCAQCGEVEGKVSDMVQGVNVREVDGESMELLQGAHWLKERIFAIEMAWNTQCQVFNTAAEL
ncbi:hypothetical protein F5141DRAFT_1067897 [Pisolithus sp. B1]|nr:hypothetical protein F5141DRAFT_1067897 [Pisolithus sp. B1]